MTIDPCPNGDYSSSSYDHTCGTAPVIPPTNPTHNAPSDEEPTEIVYDTTHTITRLQLAQMVVPFAMEVIHIPRDTNKKCIYSDTKNLSKNDIGLLTLSCELGLM